MARTSKVSLLVRLVVRPTLLACTAFSAAENLTGSGQSPAPARAPGPRGASPPGRQGEKPDRGHEFQALFHWHVADQGIRHVYIKPRSPQLNGKVERSHRTDQQEFYQLLSYKGDVDLEQRLASPCLSHQATNRATAAP